VAVGAVVALPPSLGSRAAVPGGPWWPCPAGPLSARSPALLPLLAVVPLRPLTPLVALLALPLVALPLVT